MNNKIENNLSVFKFLVLFLICGSSFAFSADVLSGLSDGFFMVLNTYIVPIVFLFTLISGAIMISAGIDWKYVLAISAVGIFIWVVFSDKNALLNSIGATRTLAKGFF